MRVAVDARHLAGGRGVAHQTAGMLAALAEGFPEDAWRAFVPGRGALAPAARGVEPSGVAFVRHPLPSRVLFGAAALTGRPRLDRLSGGADAVWLPAPALVSVSPGVPYVLTVHDVSWVERPADFTICERLWHRLGRLDRLAHGAAAVAAVSHATRTGLLRAWPRLDADRVHVVHPGVAPPADGPVPPGLPERFILAVGALEPRKGLELLVRAHARARESGLEADLVLAGTGRLAGRLRAPHVHVLGRLEALGPLYRRAIALAMPTHLEGFGLPPLEAALAGTASIVPDDPVFAETLDDAAVVVPERTEEAWSLALLGTAEDDRLRAQLAEAAAERARAFSFARAAAELRELLAAAA